MRAWNVLSLTSRGSSGAGLLWGWVYVVRPHSCLLSLLPHAWQVRTSAGAQCTPDNHCHAGTHPAHWQTPDIGMGQPLSPGEPRCVPQPHPYVHACRAR